MRGKKYTQKEILFLQKFYPKHGSKYCSEKLNRNRDAIIAMCNRLKIKCKYTSYHKMNTDRNVNPELFYNITLPEIAYFLGLIWGDGYLSYGKKTYQIRIDSLEKDGLIYYNIFSKFGKWKKYFVKKKNKNRNNKPQLIIAIGNKPLNTFLAKNDYKRKSTVSPTKILSLIPIKLHNYFWRGFLDADGCIYVNNKLYKKKRYISFTGSYSQKWTDLTKLLDKLQIKYLYRKSTSLSKNGKLSKRSRIYIGSKESVKILGNYLYKNYTNDKIGLPRKFKKFQEFIRYSN